MTSSNPRHTHAWRKLSKQRITIAAANNEPCAWCGGAIPYSEVHHNHRLAPTADHPDLLAHGGQLLPPLMDLNVHHRKCGGQQGAAVTNTRQGLGPGSRGGKTNTQTKATKAPQRPPKATALPTTDPNPKRSESRLHGPPLGPPRSTPRKGEKCVFEHATGPLDIHDDAYAPPRLLTPPHPDAAGSLADEWIGWFEDGERGPGIRLRTWQKVVLWRALEVDGAGRLCWRDVTVSTPRQQGKGWLAMCWALARCRFAEHFGEPQTVLHIANNLAAARRIHSLSWRWAEGAGLDVRKAMGVERVIYPDGSSWDITSARAVWGASGSAIADECWDLEEEVVTSAIVPTMVERRDSQLWLMSTANEEATPLMPAYRRRALAGAPRAMIAEWSVAPGADVSDPVVWRAASPHWSEARGELMAASVGTRGFTAQWCNQWPGERAGVLHWLAGWSGCGRSHGSPVGGVGGLEVSGDRSRFGAAVAVRRDDGSVDVWAEVFGSLGAALVWLEERAPVRVLCGMSLRDQCVGAWETVGAGVKESHHSTPWLLAAVRDGVLRHDHVFGVGEQVERSRVVETETGPLLSAKRSVGQVSAVKALAWAAWSAAVEEDSEAVIW